MQANVTVPVPVRLLGCQDLLPSIINDFNGTENASGIYPIGTKTSCMDSITT